MVAAAAREIRDGELVFVGMRLPMIAFALAKRTHAPGATGLFENGIIRDTPAPTLLYTMGDPPNLCGATFCGDMISVMSSLAAGPRECWFSRSGGSRPVRQSQHDLGLEEREAGAAAGFRRRLRHCLPCAAHGRDSRA